MAERTEKYIVLLRPVKVHNAHNSQAISFETVKVINWGPITTRTSNTLQSIKIFILYKSTTHSLLATAIKEKKTNCKNKD